MKPIAFFKRSDQFVGINGITNSNVIGEFRRILSENTSDFLIRPFKSGLLMGARKESSLRFKVINSNTLKISGFKDSSLFLQILQLIPIRAEYSVKEKELTLFS